MEHPIYILVVVNPIFLEEIQQGDSDSIHEIWMLRKWQMRNELKFQVVNVDFGHSTI